MKVTENTTSSVDLNELLEQIREQLGDILGDPDTAYERVVRRRLGSSAASLLAECHGPVSPIEVSEQELGVAESPSKYQYRMKSTGSLLINWQRVLTRKRLDETAEKVLAFKA